MLAFALSGAAALIYQVIWQRVLVLHTGVGAQSVAMIVAVFMAGLGIGAELGGVISARISRRRSLLLFGAVELGIAGFGASSLWLLYDLMYVRFSWLYTSVWAGALLHFATLILPTLLMGMSLPLLVRAAVGRSGAVSETIGLLYGTNVLGAALGSLLTPWVLVPAVGLRGASWCAVGANVAATLLAFIVARREPGEDALPAEPHASAIPVPISEAPAPFRVWIALYAATGAVAMALEVVWFRLTDLAVKSSPFTFGTVLALYLFGLGAGSLLGGRFALGVTRPMRAFLICQIGIVGYAAAAVATISHLSPDVPGYGWYVAYWARSLGLHPGGQGWNGIEALRLYLGIPVFLFGVPAVLMGVSFALLQRAVQDDVRTSGRKVGVLQSANILGCIVGSLVTGLVLLDQVGSSGVLRLLIVVGVGFAAIGASRSSGFKVPAAVLIGLWFALPSQSLLWSRLHGEAAPTDLVDEDATGVAALLPLDGGGWRLLNNGWSHSSLPFGAHTALGLLPVIVHPNPVDVAIIGLGSGDTAWAAGVRRETRSITVFELRAGQLPLLRRVAEGGTLPQLSRFLADPRVQVRIEDGRRALAASPVRYDVIETDPLFPYNSGSGLLYSREFYELAASRLKPGGIMCAWTPTRRVTDTFRMVFQNVVLFRGAALLVGSNDPLPRDPNAWIDRFDDPEIARYLQPRVIEKLVFRDSSVLSRDGRRPWNPLAPNLDLFPRDEFAR